MERLQLIRNSMAFPVDNFLGLFIYALIYMLLAGLIATLALHFIPNRIPYAIKSILVFIAITLSLLLWWKTFFSFVKVC